MKLNALVAALFALAAFPLAAQADGVYKLDATKSSITYKIVHKFHEVEGTSKALQGAAAVKGSDAQVQIRVPITSFDSGNANRDGHMKETVEESKFPDVTLKGVIKGFTVPATFPGDVNAKLEGQLTFHGQTNPITVPVVVTFESADKAHAKAAFDVSLDQYKVERPSLVFVKIEDACHITVDVQFAK